MVAETMDCLQAALADRYRTLNDRDRGGTATLLLVENRKPERHIAVQAARPEPADVLG